MDANERDLLKKVLPERFTIEPLQGVRPRFNIRDEEGEVIVQGVSTTAKGALVELMEQCRRNGVNEGRYAALQQVRVALGIDQQIRELWVEVNELKQR
ncbi:MAG: hypothetical protein JNL05_12985 [Flavobacteriales bacterium]|nr:hypothetical protein [Flavobacteriales bacterium]